MKKYCWNTHRFSANPQKVGEELEKIELLGELSSETILQYAEEHKDSELYKCFEWNDKEASQRYRLHQASCILTNISLEIKESAVEKQRVYYSVVSSNNGSRKFKNIKEILKNDEEYEQMILKAKNEFDSCKDKYQRLINKEDLKEIVFEIYKEI